MHPIRGTAGTARGADTVRSNEVLDTGASPCASLAGKHDAREMDHGLALAESKVPCFAWNDSALNSYVLVMQAEAVPAARSCTLEELVHRWVAIVSSSNANQIVSRAVLVFDKRIDHEISSIDPLDYNNLPEVSVPVLLYGAN